MKPETGLAPLELEETQLDHPVPGRRVSDSGIFYRSCNFGGGREFRVFKCVDVPFPDQIHGDQKLTYPDVGQRLKLQYLECTAADLSVSIR